MSVLSIDLGTTGCKAAVFEGGELLGLASRHCGCATPQEGWAEQDAEEAWGLVKTVAQEAVAAASKGPRAEAVCVSVQGDAIIPVDREGRALHPAILGMDTRSHREAADLEARFGRSELYARTGMPCEPLNAITKILWLQRNRPELRKRLWKYLHYEEFLLYRLGGVPALDHSMASRTMAFDPVAGSWVGEILNAVEVTPDELGLPCPSGEVVGTVPRDLSEELGIQAGAAVIAGAHDQCMAAVGAGVIDGGAACYSMGTAEVIATCFQTPHLTREMLDSNYPCTLHAAPERFFTITLNQSGGISLEWFQGLWRDGATMSDQERSTAYSEATGALAVSPSPIIFVPHLVGSGTPLCDHRSRGAFVGLALHTTRADLFQAVVDALAFEARLNLETLEGLGIPVADLRAVGGGTRSRRVLEIKATVLERPILTLKVPEAALLGAALVAQTASGRFRSLADACEACVKIDDRVEPVERSMAAYSAAFERFRRVPGLLRPLYHERAYHERAYHERAD